MKKVIIFIAIIVLLFGGLIVLNKMQNAAKLKDNPYGTNDLRQETIDQLDDPLYQNIILPDDLEERLAAGEDVMVYFFSPTCPHCKAATPVVAPLAEDMGIDLVQYNLWEFEEGWNLYGIEATPTIIEFKDGKKYDSITGNWDKAIFEKWFELDKPEFEQWFNENVKQ